MTPSQRNPAPADAGDAPTTGAGARLGDEMLERMTDGFIALDRDWRIVYMNSAAMGLNQRPRPDVIGRSHWEEWPMTVGSEVERRYRKAMETQRPAHFEHHYVFPGADFWHAIHAYPDANGLSIFYRDITEQKRAEQLAKLLASASARFAGTLDERTTMRIVAEMALPLLGEWACVYLVDEHWHVNGVGLAAMDERDRSLLQQVVAQLPVSATDDRLPWNRAMQGIAPLAIVPDQSFYAALGEQSLQDFVKALAPASLLCVPLVARGRVIGGITFGVSAGHRPHDEHDVLAAQEVALPSALALDSARLFDAERRARREAEDAQARAEEANRSKVDFLRAMSHELRTPLNAIGGYAELMLMGVRGEISAQQRSDLLRIRRNHAHVTSLINDVLHFAKLETGRVEFDVKRIPVRTLLTELEEIVAPELNERKQRELVIRPPSGDVHVWADTAKATQVLVNLVSNAMKHTRPGTIIEVFCESAEHEPRASISVRDDGEGIHPDNQVRIFEPFVQIGRETNRPIEGLGLGLAIARDLARRMRGELTVTSTPGKGATFTLTLPQR